MALREHPRREQREIGGAARDPGRPEEGHSALLRVPERKVLDVAGVERKPPLRGKLSLSPRQKVQCRAGMIGGFSQHDPAEEIRDHETGVEADHRGEKIGEAVVIVPGHLPVPGNLHRLEPGEIPEEVPESERKRRPSADRPENGGGIPASVRLRAAARDPMGDRGGKEDQRDGEKPGGNSGSPSSFLPAADFDMGSGSSTSQRSFSSSVRPLAASLHFAARASHARDRGSSFPFVNSASLA